MWPEPLLQRWYGRRVLHIALYCQLHAAAAILAHKLLLIALISLSLQELAQKLIVVVGEDELSKEAQRNATTTFFTHLRATLASKRVLGEYK
jgi:hypothetical protein